MRVRMTKRKTKPRLKMARKEKKRAKLRTE